MIAVSDVTKKFGSKKAVDNLSCNIPQGCIYGLVGSNGAGKSTLLRVVTGIYKPESGSVCYDGEEVYDNPDVKKRFAFVPDELYFLPQSNMIRMSKLYAANYPNFDSNRMTELAEAFGLDKKANFNTFSKGMKRQAATIMALSCKSDYLFMDETMDGLDPVVRNRVKKTVREDIRSRNATAVITSHSLRELEDTCEQLALLHEGGLIFERDVQKLKTSFFKIQLAFDHEYDESFFDRIDYRSFTKSGSVAKLIVEGEKKEILSRLKDKDPILLETLPLTLEEVFIHEMDIRGYIPEAVADKEPGKEGEATV